MPDRPCQPLAVAMQVPAGCRAPCAAAHPPLTWGLHSGCPLRALTLSAATRVTPVLRGVRPGRAGGSTPWAQASGSMRVVKFLALHYTAGPTFACAPRPSWIVRTLSLRPQRRPVQLLQHLQHAAGQPALTL